MDLKEVFKRDCPKWTPSESLIDKIDSAIHSKEFIRNKEYGA